DLRRDHETVAIRELHVEQHRVRRIACDRVKRLRSVSGLAGDYVAGPLQQLPCASAKRQMVVDDQHCAHSRNRLTSVTGASEGFPWNREDSLDSLGPAMNDERRELVAGVCARVVVSPIPPGG